MQFLQLVPGLDKHRDSVTADVCVRLFGGGLAGITAASMTYPLDLVRTRLAAQVIILFIFDSQKHNSIFLTLGPGSEISFLIVFDLSKTSRHVRLSGSQTEPSFPS